MSFKVARIALRKCVKKFNEGLWRKNDPIPVAHPALNIGKLVSVGSARQATANVGIEDQFLHGILTLLPTPIASTIVPSISSVPTNAFKNMQN